MKDRPILFSGPMVRAILDGRKTVTRRVVSESTRIGYPHDEIDRVVSNGFVTTGGLAFQWKCPYGVAGDRLWVRETWARLDPSEPHGRSGFIYRADETWAASPWRPSIFMPREACRITLEVVSVRVERLQEITEADAELEGCPRWAVPAGQESRYPHRPRLDFVMLWDQINGKRCPWILNPWVWRIEFRRLP